MSQHRARDKACPVVIRRQADRLDVLALRHPLAGLQLVKGSIEADETAAHAAKRELAEEAGLHAVAVAELCICAIGMQNQVWSFQLMLPAKTPPETWTHFAADDGGHRFEFFWHPLATQPDQQWHPVFQQALACLRQHIPMLEAHCGVGSTPT